jgi:hypothetical protein
LLGGVECCRWVDVDLCSACETGSELLGWEHPPRAYTDQFAGVA